MKRICLLLLTICCFFNYAYINAEEKTQPLIPIVSQGLPIIDLTKNYPEKDFSLDDAKKEYIPLETTNKVLCDRDFMLEYISDKYIVGKNRSRGDVFIFGRNGKVISRFNNKGQSGKEYLHITSIVFDEKKQEIFIADHLLKNQCLVYSIDGNFLRKFNFPADSWIVEIYDFDEQSLLIYNGHRKDLDDKNIINQKKPYLFISKKDGSVVSRLELSFPKRISDSYVLEVKEDESRSIRIKVGSYGIKYGNEYIIADRSCDTVFLMTRDKKLTPLFIRTPSCFNEKKLITMGINLKTDQFLFFGTVTYEWSELISQYKRGQQVSPPPGKEFAYNLQTGEIFSVTKGVSFGLCDANGKIAARQRRASRLINDLKEGKLEGKIKQVAQIINEDDNDVVEITKIK